MRSPPQRQSETPTQASKTRKCCFKFLNGCSVGSMVFMPSPACHLMLPSLPPIIAVGNGNIFIHL